MQCSTYFSIFGGCHLDTLSQGLHNRHGVVFLVFIAVGGAAAVVAVAVLVFSDRRVVVVVDVSVSLVAVIVIPRGSGHDFIEIESFQVEGWTKKKCLLFDTLGYIYSSLTNSFGNFGLTSFATLGSS